MTNERLQQLASLISQNLPSDYQRLLMNYPDSFRTMPRADDGSGAEGFVSDVELIADPECVLAINREARRESVPDPDGDEFFWPEQLIIIGESGAGDYYCIDASGEHVGVLQFDHHAVEFDQITESLSEFVDMLAVAYPVDHETELAMTSDRTESLHENT